MITVTLGLILLKGLEAVASGAYPSSSTRSENTGKQLAAQKSSETYRPMLFNTLPLITITHKVHWGTAQGWRERWAEAEDKPNATLGQ